MRVYACVCVCVCVCGRVGVGELVRRGCDLLLSAVLPMTCLIEPTRRSKQGSVGASSTTYGLDCTVGYTHTCTHTHTNRHPKAQSTPHRVCRSFTNIWFQQMSRCLPVPGPTPHLQRLCVRSLASSDRPPPFLPFHFGRLEPEQTYLALAFPSLWSGSICFAQMRLTLDGGRVGGSAPGLKPPPPEDDKPNPATA